MTMNREEEIRKAAEQYELDVLDNADLNVNYEENNYDAGARDAILEVTQKSFIDGAQWADEHPKNQWIDTRVCKGSDSSADCILIREGGIVTRGYYNDDEGWIEYPDYKYVLDDVCYWMDCEFFKD